MKFNTNRFTLSLRSFMVITLILGVGIGWYINSVQSQHRAIVAIQQVNGRVLYDWEYQDGKSIRNPIPPWLSRWFPEPSYYSSVTCVVLSSGYHDIFTGTKPDVYINNQLIDSISRLNHIELLDVRGNISFDNDSLKKISKLDSLRKLYISDTSVQGSGIALIKNLTQLRVLEMNGIIVSSDEIKNLREFNELESISVDIDDISNSGLSFLDHLTKLNSVQLKVRGNVASPITSEGLYHFASLKNLKFLQIGHSNIKSFEPINHLRSHAIFDIDYQ